MNISLCDGGAGNCEACKINQNNCQYDNLEMTCRKSQNTNIFIDGVDSGFKVFFIDQPEVIAIIDKNGQRLTAAVEQACGIFR